MTQLSPLEEALFQSWTKAHGVQDADDPKNQFDHRGLYKQTNGMIMPGKVVRDMATSHNKAMEPQDAGPDITNPDPYMAAAEMHGNTLKAQTDMKKESMKGQLESQKHSQKVQLEQMKLAHQSAEKDKDRQHKAAQEERNRQIQAQEAEKQRAQATQDAQVQRQQQLQDGQMQQQQDLHGQVLREHLTRTRPQPAPTPGMAPQGQPGMPPPQGGQPPQSQPQTAPSPHGGNGLHQQLMQRAMGPGRS